MKIHALVLYGLCAGLALPALAADKAVERGRYLISISGCNDCHTPGYFFGKPDMARFLGGSEVGFEIPGLGVFHGPNLTPDPETGLGTWSTEQITAAITKGKRPDGRELAHFGIVVEGSGQIEGATLPSDTERISAAHTMPGVTTRRIEVQILRTVPELWLAPGPGAAVHRAVGAHRAAALFLDQMERPLAVGLDQAGQPIYADFAFIDGEKGGHVSISGISGVATKTSTALALIRLLLAHPAMRRRVRVLLFNVKGEDLLFLDHANTLLSPDDAARYGALGLAPGPFSSVAVFAPPVKGDRNARPDVASRQEGVTSFFWTIEEFCHQRLLAYLFADVEDDRQQYPMLVHNVAARLDHAVPAGDGAVNVDGQIVRTFRELVELIELKVDPDGEDQWAGRAIGSGTVNAFIRRLHGAIDHVQHLVRGDIPKPGDHAVDFDRAQVTVVDLHNLDDRGKRFVVGVTLRRAFDDKERMGLARPLLFVVLDELNKYAPRDGDSPIKEILLDVAERGRSLGIVLIGAQQTASEVERRIISNSSIRLSRLITVRARSSCPRTSASIASTRRRLASGPIWCASSSPSPTTRALAAAVNCSTKSS